MLSPIERVGVSEEVFRRMLDMISSGQWKLGELIPSESELQATFSVSRATVRQAIQRLSALGLLRSKQGKGTYVDQVDIRFYLNQLVPAIVLGNNDSIAIMQFLKSIQVECARIVAGSADDAAIAQLTECLTDMKDAKTYDAFFAADIRFHSCLTILTGNPLFFKTDELIELLMQDSLREIGFVHGSGKSMLQHTECLEHIKAHNPEAAADAMARHYDMLLERITAWLAMDEQSRQAKKESVKNAYEKK